MIEPPPDLPAESIVARVRDRYAVPVAEATFLPIGNDSLAWSFRLEGDGARWFLKVFRRVDAAALELPRFLAARGIEHLVPARSTRDGAAVDKGEPYSLALFPFVDGVTGGEIGLTPAQRVELGRFLRSVHDATPDEGLAALLRRERFLVRDVAYIERAGRTLDVEPPDVIAAALLAQWRAHLDEIAKAVERASTLAAYGRRTAPPSVLCHADFHAWNVLIEPSGEMRVVDWDWALLAPSERDLMFVSGDTADIDPSGEDFYRGYGDVEIDPTLIAYYRFDWVLQEVADYHRRVFDIALGEQTRAEAIDHFVELFGPEDVFAAAYRADAAIPSR
jgi:spectinomycin phosphotransferase